MYNLIVLPPRGIIAHPFGCFSSSGKPLAVCHVTRPSGAREAIPSQQHSPIEISNSLSRQTLLYCALRASETKWSGMSEVISAPARASAAANAAVCPLVLLSRVARGSDRQSPPAHKSHRSGERRASERIVCVVIGARILFSNIDGYGS